MKRPIAFLPVLLLFACTSGNTPEPAEPKQPAVQNEPLKLRSNDPNWNDWLAYYRSKKPDFGPEDFLLKDTSWTEQLKGNVYGIFDPEFDSIYAPFLVYSPDKTKYIDLDSYQWAVGKDNEPSFNPDQEIDLVDVQRKTIQRITFRGPSQSVENVAWKDNYTIYLLENSADRIPSVTEIDLRDGQTRVYVYDGKLPARYDYSRQRMKRLLKRTAQPVAGLE